MRPDDLRGLLRLAGRASRGGVRGIEGMHASISDRVFTAVGPAGDPVRAVHDRVATAAYGGVLAGIAVGAAAAEAGAGLVRPSDAPPMADHPRGRFVVAALNGLHGDLLADEVPELALGTALRLGGADLDPADLPAAYPDATPRIAVFLHGLGETEDAWRYRAGARHGDPGTTYGSLLRADLGITPVWVRYNSGLRISDNGARLSELLEQLVAYWPVEVADMVLVGHSMGGLVARAALHQAARQQVDEDAAAGGAAPLDPTWPLVVADTVTLGSPHLGAPLEQAVHLATYLLDQTGETRLLASVLRSRSVGIKDLRHGTVVADDWRGRHPDARGPAPRTHLPLYDHARHFVVLTTVVGTHDSLAGDLVGDLLVRPRSAVGDSGDERRWDLPEGHVLRLSGLHHLDLLNHPQVYAGLRDWLASR